MTNANLGQSLLRFEDRRFLTGEGRYTADIDLDDQLYGFVLRSPYAHAAILGIDAAAAAEQPGVVAVYTEADLGADGVGALPCVASVATVDPIIVPPRYALARDRVRHVGDPVAFVAAESLAAALDAVELIEVDYQALPAVADQRAALAPGAPELWAEAANNLSYRFRKGDRAAVERAMAEAAHVVELDITNNRVSAAPIEPRVAIGAHDPATDVLTLTVAGQGVHGIRNQLAGAIFNLPNEKIRVLAPAIPGTS